MVKNNGLVLRRKKLELFRTKIKFLGHTIENGQITLQKHAFEFTDNFPDKIIEKTKLIVKVKTTIEKKTLTHT